MSETLTVRLSRGALEEARLSRGIYQQTIAYYISDRQPERYSLNPPFKLVNRAFNRHRVRLANATLIAEVLGVPLREVLDLADDSTRQAATDQGLL